MKILKLKLHWQILIALILSVIYGLIFPTRYSFNPDSIKELRKDRISQETIAKIEIKGDIEYTTLKDFQKALKQTLTEEEYSKNQSILRKACYDNRSINAVSWLGDIFIRALKMLIIPLILSSLISGITNIGTGKNLGRLGLKTMSYYISTSLLAIVTGLLFVNILKPGIGADLNFQEHVEGLVEKQRSFIDILIDIIPQNIFEAFTKSDMLSIIFFAMLFGFFISKSEEVTREILRKAFNAIFEVMMKITLFIIRFTPLGIFGIVAKVIADQDDLFSLFSRMGLYMITVVAALTVHFLITLPLFLKFIGKSDPWKHFQNMTTPLLTAFSTSSSGATLPLTIEAVESKSGVSNKISSFTLPLGATINMDGTALYECVAAIFIAQAYGHDLTIVQQVIIVITSLLASIGAAAIPMAGLVMITVILTAIGLPLEGIGLILAVDRILDMFRTATNVWSDSCGAVIIAKSEGEQLLV